jgi:hypothetical protein
VSTGPGKYEKPENSMEFFESLQLQENPWNFMIGLFKIK